MFTQILFHPVINYLGFKFFPQYILETFNEQRNTERLYELYHGGPVDGPNCGTAPKPWDIPVKPKQLFVNHNMKVRIPHTEQVKVSMFKNLFS